MPSLSERSRNNVRAGVFVTLSLMLGLAVVFILTGAWDRLTAARDEYVVVFDVETGVSNLSKGSQVRIGGIVKGRVLEVEPRLAEGRRTRTLEAIGVRFELDREIQLFEGAKMFISVQLVGTEAWLDIISVGDPELGAPEDGVFKGLSGSGLLMAMLGADNAANAGEFTAFLGSMQEKYEASVQPILDDVRGTTGDVRGMVGEVRNDQWPRWSGRVDEVMDWAATATTSIDGIFAEGEGLLADGRGVIRENRDDVRTIATNAAATSEDVRSAGGDVREITRTVREDSLVRITAFLEQTSEGVDDAIALVRQLAVDYEMWSEDLGETLGNSDLASEQLRLALVEIRRSPWKLLYKPTSDSELDHEMLYEATRSFAVAVADLKAASNSMRRVVERHSDALAEDPELVQRIRDNLMDSLSRYETAQQRLFDVLIESSE